MYYFIDVWLHNVQCGRPNVLKKMNFLRSVVLEHLQILAKFRPFVLKNEGQWSDDLAKGQSLTSFIDMQVFAK